MKKTKGMLDQMERRHDSNKWHLAVAKREALIKIGDSLGVKWPENPRNMRIGYIEKILRNGGKIFMNINECVKAVHENAVNKGWYEEPRSFGEVIALMHSELSEALEDHRNGRGLTEIYYEGEKPCGIPIELADTVIRIMDTCGNLGIDLEAAIKMKMAYNTTRSIRHGGKKL